MRRVPPCLLKEASKRIPKVQLSEVGLKKMTSLPLPPLALQANDVIKKSAGRGTEVGLVEIVGSPGTSHGVASYNPSAYTSCRILHRNSQTIIDHNYFLTAFTRALQARTAAFGRPREKSFRLINSDGDHLPGLYIDIISPNEACISPTTAFMDRQIDLIVSSLRVVFPTLKKIHLCHDVDPICRSLELLPILRSRVVWSAEEGPFSTENGEDLCGTKLRNTVDSGGPRLGSSMRDAELIRNLPTYLRLARPEATRRKVLALYGDAGRAAVATGRLLEEARTSDRVILGALTGKEDVVIKAMIVAVEPSARFCRSVEESISLNSIESRFVTEHEVPTVWLEERAQKGAAGEFDLLLLTPPCELGADIDRLKQLLSMAADQLVPGGVMVLTGVNDIRYKRYQKVLLQALAASRVGRAPKSNSLIYESSGCPDLPRSLLASARDSCVERVMAVRVGMDSYEIS
ncbi:hypothetical protein FOL47_004019 [Perkinsus chesapeaki]|uniref:Uncharacterized protein n=1 Tax=Perkinsus chesapeaki TaxID=330153 RepID=A0A7J6M4Z6_PERCH|nr:hypothetical protein FOL47_004019 [Perkinsus chesapeaki]